MTHMLSWLWSPRQIAQTLLTMWPDDPELHVSHQTIYTAIYPDPKGELCKNLVGRAFVKTRATVKHAPLVTIGAAKWCSSSRWRKRRMLTRSGMRSKLDRSANSRYGAVSKRASFMAR